MYNFQACSSPLLIAHPERSLCDQQLCAVVVHTVTVIMCTKNNSLLTILQHFVRSSSDLKVRRNISRVWLAFFVVMYVPFIS